MNIGTQRPMSPSGVIWIVFLCKISYSIDLYVPCQMEPKGNTQRTENGAGSSQRDAITISSHNRIAKTRSVVLEAYMFAYLAYNDHLRKG